MVGFKANRIAHVSPKALPPLLRWLILTDNALTDLPAEIGQCTQMQKLALAGNQLKSLPPELANLQPLRTYSYFRESTDRISKLAAPYATPDLAGVRRQSVLRTLGIRCDG
jgi:hypothetical protein